MTVCFSQICQLLTFCQLSFHFLSSCDTLVRISLELLSLLEKLLLVPSFIRFYLFCVQCLCKNEIKPLKLTSITHCQLSGSYAGCKKRFPVLKENSFAYGETDFHRFRRSKAQQSQRLMFLRRQAR